MRLIMIIFCVIAVMRCRLAAQSRIVVSKVRMELAVVEEGDTIFSCPCALGKNYGDKQRKGDCKTPEGSFTICSIEDSSSWKHDFNDGLGVRDHAYGSYFFRLKVPRFSEIGIHGTCMPASIGTRSSEGCVRLRDSDLLELKKHIRIGMTCVIEKDSI